MPSPRITLALALVLVLACGKTGDPTKASFTPGPKLDTTLAKLGGVTLSVPDNLKITETEGSATLAAEGFPTITITVAEGEFNGTGTRVKTSMGDVTGVYRIPTREWTCTAKDTGDHEQLVVEICESLLAPQNPNVSRMTCKTIDGFDADPVAKAWSETAAGFTACLAPQDHTGVAFGFNFELAGESRHFTTYTSPPVNDGEAGKCLDAIYDELRKTSTFSKESLTAGQIECDGSYSRY